MKNPALISTLLASLLAGATVASAAVEKGIFLVGQSGSETQIGKLLLTPSDKGHSVSISMDETKFTDHFLSMRPFKCITAEQYQLCHLPYPYENHRQISSDALTDLEYELLFIRRSPTDYGINPWFGVYYRLNPLEGAELSYRGTLHETNLDVLAAPPEDGNLRPITADELYEADPQQHHWPTLEIR